MRNIPIKVTGDDLTADEFNDIPEEEENLITSTGQALTAGDLRQIAKAVATYTAVGDFFGDSGSGNNYILFPLSSFAAPTQYWDGMRVRFRISHENTGSSTINVNGLGVKNIVKEDGVSPLAAGDLPIGEHGELIFHADKDAFELYSHKNQNNSFITGDLIITTRTAVRPGWISYFSPGTIGSATSGATIRANADTEQLFKLWWAQFSNALCPVSGGRGATADADWAANKTIGVYPFYTHYMLCLANNLAGAVGTQFGEAAHTLSIGEMPGHTHSYLITDGGQGHGGDKPDVMNYTTTVALTGGQGGSQPHNNLPPSSVMNFYVKL